MKKLVLKQWVKDLIVMTVASLVIIAGVMLVANRVDEIDNGSVEVVSESEMAERN